MLLSLLWGAPEQVHYAYAGNSSLPGYSCPMLHVPVVPILVYYVTLASTCLRHPQPGRPVTPSTNIYFDSCNCLQEIARYATVALIACIQAI
jgi:hypothetical protein